MKKNMSTNPPLSLDALSTDEVTRLCKRSVEGTGCKYLGTYPAWGGPDVKTWAEHAVTQDTAFVANTDTVEDEGAHWTLFYLPKDLTDPPYFFDSFGRSPDRMGRPMWRNYLRAIANCRGPRIGGGRPVWRRNDIRVQDKNTTVCGQLCGLVLWLKARGMPLPKKVVSLDLVKQYLVDMRKK